MMVELARKMHKHRKTKSSAQCKPGFDWVGFFVRFVVGVTFGVFFAFGILSARGFRAAFLEDESLLWFGVTAISLLMGCIFAMLGSDFWISFLNGRFRK